MKIYCLKCKEWLAVRGEDGEPLSQAKDRTRRNHRCRSVIQAEFDAIVGNEEWSFS